MHAESMALMDNHLQRQLIQSRIQYPRVLDVGARDYNGSYRNLCASHGMYYWGIDLTDGNNVDQVVDPEKWDIADGEYDVVICGNAFHNIARPWVVIKEMERILSNRGLLIVVTIWSHGFNAYPVDYWRFTSDGLRVLFDEAETLTDYKVEMDDLGNTAGSAIKR